MTTPCDRARIPRLAGLLAVLAACALAAFALAALASGPTTLPAARAAQPTGGFSVVRVDDGRSLRELQEEASRVRESMERLKTEMARVSDEYASTRAELDRIGGELVETRVELARTQSLLDTQTMIVSAHMTALYKSGDETWLDILARAGSFSQLESDVRLLHRVMDEDQEAGRELFRLTQSAEELEAGLAERRERTLVLETEIDAQRAVMADALAERRALLEGLTARIEELLVGQLPAGLKKAPKGGYNQLTWAKALLKSLGAPVTTPSLAALVAWEMAEGGHWNNSAHYNPLNTTWKMPGATSMNSVGVKAYVSWEQGFKATLRTLHNGFYGGILAALRAGDDAQAVADAVAASPWGTHSFTVR
jgi:peptidoglycan hydrolase CwlO-like protein